MVSTFPTSSEVILEIRDGAYSIGELNAAVQSIKGGDVSASRKEANPRKWSTRSSDQFANYSTRRLEPGVSTDLQLLLAHHKLVPNALPMTTIPSFTSIASLSKLLSHHLSRYIASGNTVSYPIHPTRNLRRLDHSCATACPLLLRTLSFLALKTLYISQLTSEGISPLQPVVPPGSMFSGPRS
jgi:hypothetical protein